MNSRNVNYFIVFCGFGLVFALSQLMFPLGILTVSFINVCVVAAYTYAIWESCEREGLKASVAEKKKWFDSIYFYGFLMTLVSLIIGLYISSDVNGGTELIASKLVQNAIALSNTVAALFSRTFLVLRIVEEEVADEENFLSAELKGIAEAVRTLKERSEQVSKVVGETSDK